MRGHHRRSALGAVAALTLLLLATACEVEVEPEAERELEQAGEELERGAEELGQGIERGAEELGREIEPYARDATITTKIKSKLTADPEVNPFTIDVDTVNGVVTLSGTVRTEEQRQEAEDLARGTEGVKEVVNSLQVGGRG